MVQATSCPDAPALRRFLLGQAGEQESAPVEEHLLHCDQCLRAVRTLPADDPLVSALREGRTSATPAPQSGLLEKLRLRLQELEPASRGPDTVSGENTEAAMPGPAPSPFEAAPAEPGPRLAPGEKAPEGANHPCPFGLSSANAGAGPPDQSEAARVKPTTTVRSDRMIPPYARNR